LIAGGYERRAILPELWMASSAGAKEMLEGRSFGEFQRFLAAADDILQAAEEEHFDANRLGDSGHQGIVARPMGRQP